MKIKIERKYLYWGVTAFCVVLACLLVYLGISRWASLVNTAKRLAAVLSPLLYGFAIAYLLNDPMMLLERKALAPLFGKLVRKKPERAQKLARLLSIVITQLLAWGVVVGLCALIAPQLYFSIESLVTKVPSYARDAMGWVERTLHDNPDLESFVVNAIGNVSEYVTRWINSFILPNMNEFLGSITAGLISVIKGLVYILVGIVISVYMLYNKERFSAQIKRILYSWLKPAAANGVLREAALVDKAFGGFLTGKLLDSLIIGVIAYIALSILRMPYVALLSVIIGVTNIIPVFGPFIGAVPCALIVLMESPLQCLVFIIFVIILQQFDGNILGPRILGNATGLSGFWVMFAILVFGGLFGFPGMILGVPTMAVLYNAVRRLNRRRLRKYSLPERTEDYINMSHMDPQTKQPIYREARPNALRDLDEIEAEFTATVEKTETAPEREDNPPDPDEK